jgi:hypothetical protein
MAREGALQAGSPTGVNPVALIRSRDRGSGKGSVKSLLENPSNRGKYNPLA